MNFVRVKTRPTTGLPNTVYVIEPGNVSWLYVNGAWKVYEQHPLQAQYYKAFKDVPSFRDTKILTSST